MTARVYKTFTFERAVALARVTPSDARRFVLLRTARPTGPGRRWTFRDVRKLRDAAEAERRAASGTTSTGSSTAAPASLLHAGVGVGIRTPLSPREMGQVSAWVDEAWALDQRPETLGLAADLYERVLARMPDHVVALVNLGNVRYQQGHREHARELYLVALRVAPTHAEANYNLGYLLFEECRYTQAEAFFRASLRVSPHFADAHFNLAETLERLGRRAESKQHWRRYLSLAPHALLADRARMKLAERADHP